MHNPLQTMDFFHLLGWLGVRIKKKHISAFLPTYPTPMSLFNSVSKDNPFIIHSTWLELLRANLEQNQMQRRNDTIRGSLEETLEKGMLGSKCI